MQIPSALTSRFWCPISLALLLEEDGLEGMTVVFVRCPSCGNDGRLYINGELQLNGSDHSAWRDLLPFLRAAMDVETFYQVRGAIAEATWMAGFAPLPPAPLLPTSAEVEQHGGMSEGAQLFDSLLRWGGDPR